MEKAITDLQTFRVPDVVSDAEACIALGKKIVKAWQSDGIFQVATSSELDATTRLAYAESKRFFAQPLEEKATFLSDLGYSGYIASGEELTAGKAYYSEIFTVTKDVGPADARSREKWPCHGPIPWPDPDYQHAMRACYSLSGQLVGGQGCRRGRVADRCGGIGTARKLVNNNPQMTWTGSRDTWGLYGVVVWNTTPYRPLVGLR